MKQEPIAVLVTEVTQKTGKVISQNILTSPIRSIGFPYDQWDGVLLSKEKTPIHCALRTFERIGVGTNEKGERVKYLDDEPFVSLGLEQELQGVAANTLEVILHTPFFPWDCPVFHSSDPSLVASEHKVTLELCVRYLNQLPDVQGYIAYAEMMDRALEGTVLSGGSQAAALREASKAMSVQSVRYLPVCLEGESRAAYLEFPLCRRLDIWKRKASSRRKLHLPQRKEVHRWLREPSLLAPVNDCTPSPGDWQYPSPIPDADASSPT